MKLSKAQKRVLWYMANGSRLEWTWEDGMGPRRGGAWHQVANRRVKILQSLGLIESASAGAILPKYKYQLTPQGAELAHAIQEGDFL